MGYKRKEDQKLANTNHYAKNKDILKKRAKAHSRKVRLEVRAYVAGYLDGHPCVDCGERDPIVLEFDHKDRARKRFNIGDAPSGGYSLGNVIREIAECDVRCANCHRRKTHRENMEQNASKKPDVLPPLPLFEFE